MKLFNLEEALAGKPVKLRNGSKAIILSRIPDTYKLENGLKVTFPLFGIILNTDGTVDDPYASWKDNGMFSSCTSDYDIVDMWKEPELTLEELMEKAFQEKLILTHSLFPSRCKGFKVVGKTLDNDYILQNCDDNEIHFLSIFRKDSKWSIKE